MNKMEQVLKALESFMQKGQEFGISYEGWQEKIAHIKEQKGLLKVALVGGFSTGKTSIIAAWLEDLDKKTMHIDQVESTDQITVYKAKGCLLIDTPGLFGFKETCDTKTHHTQAYKEKTEKFVSEAHLILYVMDPQNPIKESNIEELRWLFNFKGIDLLSRSVFVLSKFDEVADMDDEEEYQEILALKKGEIQKELKHALNLSQEQAKGLRVVAVSANPYNRGVEYWLKNLEEFRQNHTSHTYKKPQKRPFKPMAEKRQSLYKRKGAC